MREGFYPPEVEEYSTWPNVQIEEETHALKLEPIAVVVSIVEAKQLHANVIRRKNYVTTKAKLMDHSVLCLGNKLIKMKSNIA